MSSIVISEFMSDAAVELLQASHSVLYQPTLVDDLNALHKALAPASALIVRNRTQVNQQLLDVAPNLKIIGRLGVGLDNIDLQACASRQINVYPATGANSDAVAEYVVMAALMLVRNCFHATARVIEGEWPRQECIGREIAGLTFGLIGCGGIAHAVTPRVKAMGMHVIGHDPLVDASSEVWQHIEQCDFMTLLQRADVISLHVPLTQETRNLIGATELSVMKDDAVLINTARGGVVDESAVATALNNHTLGGAALDVFEQEPVEAGTMSAESLKSISGVANVLLTPHVAGVTTQSNERVSMLTARNVLADLGS